VATHLCLGLSRVTWGQYLSRCKIDASNLNPKLHENYLQPKTGAPFMYVCFHVAHAAKQSYSSEQRMGPSRDHSGASASVGAHCTAGNTNDAVAF